MPDKQTLQLQLEVINARIQAVELSMQLGQYQHRDLMTEGQKVVEQLKALEAAEKEAAPVAPAPEAKE